MKRSFSRAAFNIPADVLGPTLLGCTLVRRLDDGTRLAGVIVETEAYLGVEDRASHSFGGRRTDRTEPMFGPGGTAYVYFTYGMHHCMNGAAGTEGDPLAVLIRALEPTEGLDAMREHRRRTAKPGSAASRSERLPDHLLCSGPGRLCRALGIDRSHSGLDLTRPGPISIERPTGVRPEESSIGRSPRIGLGEAGVWKTRPLRFFLRSSRSVSGSRACAGPVNE